MNYKKYYTNGIIKLIFQIVFCWFPIAAFASSSIGIDEYIVVTKSKTFASQITHKNAVYEIRDKFDLKGARIKIPSDCMLIFRGGSLSNGSVEFNNCIIDAPLYAIFNNNVTCIGKPNVPTIYPEWFGAVGDGRADDAKAIQKCIDMGISVSLSSKTYKITQPLTLKSGCTLQGNGWSTTVKAVKCNAIESQNTCNGVLIRDMKIDGDQSPSHSGIYITAPMPKMIIQNLHISNFGYYGMYLLKSWDYAIENVNLTTNKNGLYAEQFNSSNLQKVVAFQNSGIGLKIVSSSNARISGTIQENGLQGLLLLGCHASSVNIYGEQNGYLGKTNEESCEILISSGGKANDCSNNNIIQFYLNGGKGSKMQSKYGLYLNWASENFLNGYSLRHTVNDIYETTNSDRNVITDTAPKTVNHLTKKNIKIQE